jgi:hypothetical protein
MTRGDLADLLVKRAKEYAPDAKKSLMRNSHMNRLTPKEKEALTQETINAIVTDFVNYTVGCAGLDLALYSKDLDGNR